MRLSLLLLCLAISMEPALAQFQAPELTPFQKKIQEVMQSDIRTAEEKARDNNRKPLQTLSFFGLKEDMKVIELVPAGGWFTKILGPVLRDKGVLYITQPGQYAGATGEVLKLPGLDKVKTLDWGQWDGELEAGVRTLPPPGKWDIDDADLVLTFRNYHNFSEQARAVLNQSVFAALKPGGHYGILDHTRRHMEPEYRENGRREDPVAVIKEVQAAGFVFVDYSNIHYTPDDELRYEVGRVSIANNSDRFTLLFKKPEN